MAKYWTNTLTICGHTGRQPKTMRSAVHIEIVWQCISTCHHARAFESLAYARTPESFKGHNGRARLRGSDPHVSGFSAMELFS